MRIIYKTVSTISTSLLILFSNMSCANGDVSEILRKYDDPADDTPRAACYSDPHSLNLSWDEDECADEYILLRAEDNGAENFTPVYTGKNTSYSDSFYQTDDQKRFIYRLDKTRGNRWFKSSDCTCAVASNTLHDMHEPNDTVETAVEIERNIEATMPCSQFRYKNRSYADEDWYFIRLKPLCTAKILFRQVGMGSSVADSDFLYMIQGDHSEELKHNEKFTVSNTSYATKNIYFKIMPNMNRIFAGNDGAAVPAYTMTVTEEIYQ